MPPTVMPRAYEEIIEFIAAGTTPQSLIMMQRLLTGGVRLTINPAAND